MTLIFVLVSALAIMAVSLTGIVFASKALQSWTERNLQYLTSLATGVFLFIAYHLLIEITESTLSTAAITGFVLLGLVIAYALNLFIANPPHYHDSGEKPHQHSPASAQRILISDSIHNVTDGLLLAPAFIVSTELGIATAIGIIVHELAQEISEFFVFRSVGYSTRQALKMNFISASAILIGAVGGYLVLFISENIVAALLSIAAGIIVYTLAHDLIPHSLSHARFEKTYGKHVLALTLGVLLIVGINLAIGDTHHGDDHTPEAVEHSHN